MDRASKDGLSNKNGRCQISFSYLGVRRRVVLRAFRYEKAAQRQEATRIRAAVLQEITRGTFDFAKWFPDHPAAKSLRRGSHITVKEALEEWLRNKRPALEATTLRGYSSAIYAHLVPSFGYLALSALEPSKVNAWLAGLGASGKRKNNILIPLRAIMRDAFLDGRIDRNPLERVAPQPVKQREADPFTQAEFDAITAAADGQVRNIFQIAVWTGLRTSELIAVKWQDVDLARKVLHVRNTRTSSGEKSYGKTKGARRSIQLFPPALEALEAQKRFTGVKEHVFEDPDTGKPWRHDGPLRRKAWIPLLRKVGVRYRNPYQLRHTYASWLLSRNVSPMFVAHQMGHKDWGMIRKVYGRWINEFSDIETAKVASLWAPDRHLSHATI